MPGQRAWSGLAVVLTDPDGRYRPTAPAVPCRRPGRRRNTLCSKSRR